MTNPSEKLTFPTKLAYGSGDMGSAITANVLIFYLLYFFTNVAGLPPGLAGSVLAIGKVADAINDPVTGILSDRTRTSWGRRIPWMVYGAIPFGMIFLLQWWVPQFSSNPSLNNWLLFGYYVLIGILFNLAYTAVNLPYTALTPELTQNYNERTSLNSFRMGFSIGGSILSLILAQLVIQAYPDDEFKQFWILGLICSGISIIAIFWCAFAIQERGAKGFLNPQQKRILGITLTIVAIGSGLYGISGIIRDGANLTTILAIILGLQVLGFGLTLLVIMPEPHLTYRQTASPASSESIPFFEQLKIVFQNKPFLYVIGIYLCSWLAVQLIASILIYFVVSWMQFPESQFPQVAIAVQGTALVMLFFWKKVSDRLGKKAVYFLGTGIWIIAQVGLFLVQPGQIPLLYLVAILAGCGVSVAYLIPWSMLPDVIDFDELKTQQRREGIFYGFMVLLQKMGLALALLLTGQALEWAGFVERIPGAGIPVQPDSALFAIRVVIGIFPIICLIGGIVLASFYPITKEFHQEILLKLQEQRRT